LQNHSFTTFGMCATENFYCIKYYEQLLGDFVPLNIYGVTIIYNELAKILRDNYEKCQWLYYCVVLQSASKLWNLRNYN
jgi:hypothetical protein